MTDLYFVQGGSDLCSFHGSWRGWRNDWTGAGTGAVDVADAGVGTDAGAGADTEVDTGAGAGYDDVPACLPRNDFGEARLQ